MAANSLALSFFFFFPAAMTTFPRESQISQALGSSTGPQGTLGMRKTCVPRSARSPLLPDSSVRRLAP